MHKFSNMKNIGGPLDSNLLSVSLHKDKIVRQFRSFTSHLDITEIKHPEKVLDKMPLHQ